MVKFETHPDESSDFKTTQGKLGIQLKSVLVGGKIEPVALVITILAAILLFSIINPRFSSVENLRNILIQVSIPLILGVGATLVILLGSIDLSLQGVMATSAMVFVLLSANSRGSQDYGIWAVIAGIITGAIFGWVNGIILTKLRVPSFVATLGMWYVGLGIATVLFGTTAIPFLSERSISGWNTRLSHGVPNSFWAAAAAVLLGTLLLRFTTIGRHTLAIGNNEVIARNSGLKVDQTKIAIFTIAGALTGVAGILGAIQLGSGSLDVGNGTLFITIPAVVIGGTALSGGKGGIFRTVLGTFLLIILSNGLILAGVSANYQSGVAGAILIIAIILSKLSYRESAGSIK